MYLFAGFCDARCVPDREVIEVINKVIAERWSLIEPAQIITDIRRAVTTNIGQMTKSDLDNARVLLDRDHIDQYGASG